MLGCGEALALKCVRRDTQQRGETYATSHSSRTGFWGMSQY